MKRIMLSVCAAVAAAVATWGAQVPVTCVQKGLIALYDGIYNSVNETGEPVHDESFVGLVDFISGRNLTLEKGSSYELASDHLQLNTAKSSSDSTTFSAAHPEIALAYTNRAFTLEMHLVNAGHFNGGYTMSFGQKDTSNRCLSFYDWSNKAYDGVMVWDTSGASSGVADPGLNKHHTVTFVAEGGTAYKFYIDGVLKKSLSKTQGTLADDVLALGGGHISGGMTEPQSYYSIRAYNRVLSADEIALNRAFDRMRFEGATFEEAFGDGWRMSLDGEALQCRVRVVSPAVGVDIGGVNFTTGTNDFWVTHGERVTVRVRPVPGQRVAWADAPAGSVSSHNGDQVSFTVTKPLAMAVAETFIPTHVWTGSSGTDFAAAANWENGTGAAVSAAPGADASVFIPVGAANQPTSSEPIDVAELRIGRLANEVGTATFTSGTNAMHHVAGELIVYAGGTMTHTALPDNANAAKDECYKLNVTAQSITIKTGGTIDVSGCGYAGAKGPGTSPGRDGGTVASHGGAMDVGKSYGSLHSPTNCGTGSSHSSYGSSRGGGAVQLVASGNITIEKSASVLADGGPKLAKSSGAGGSVWLKCATLVGAGIISVSGQDPDYGMGGCGGRIAVWQSEGTDFTTAWTGKMQAVSGCGGGSDDGRTRGGPGTVYLQAKDETVTNATVIIDNADKIHGTTTAVYGNHWRDGRVVVNGFVELCARTGSDKIGNLIVRKKAHALVPEGETLQVYGNIDTTGGYTYTVGAAVQMCGPKTATISGSAPYSNFVCTEPGKTLLFGTTANDCFEISAGGSLTLAGTEGSTVNLFPAGDDPAKLWAMKFGVDAVSDVNYASVSNSNASAGDKAVSAYFSNNLGGNTKWAFTTPVVEGETITWTGAANDDWNEPANWSRGRMVADTDVVVIPSEKGGEAITNMPKISVGNITLNALTVEADAMLTLDGTPSLTVTNSLAVAGALVVASKVKITCTKDVNFAGGSFTAVGRFGPGALLSDTAGGTADGTVAFGAGCDVEFADGAQVTMTCTPNQESSIRGWIYSPSRASGSVRFVREGLMSFKGGLAVNNYDLKVSDTKKFVYSFDGGIFKPTIATADPSRTDAYKECRYAIFKSPAYQGFEAGACGMTVDMSECTRYTIAAPVRGVGTIEKVGSGVLVLGTGRTFADGFTTVRGFNDNDVTNDATKVVESGVVTVLNAGGVHVAEGTVEVEAGATDTNSCFAVEAGCTVDLAGNTVELGALKGEGEVSGGTISAVCFKPLAEGESAATLKDVSVGKVYVDFGGAAIKGVRYLIAKVGAGVTGTMAEKTFRAKAINTGDSLLKEVDCITDDIGNVFASIPLTVSYYDPVSGETKSVEAVEVTESTDTFADGQWYVVTGTVERGSITVNGEAHLILCDGAKLTAVGGTNEAGIAVAAGNSLTIYGQALGTGELVATAAYYCAGIGGTNGVACGTVTINGGKVTAKATSRGAGIGGGYKGDGGVVTINGGYVKANGHYKSAGIGGGGLGNGGKVTIRGGRVEAQTTDYGAPIGGGSNGNGGDVTIEGGTVVTSISPYYDVNIGGGISAKEGATVTITGGSVLAATIQNAPTNGANAAAWCVTVDVEKLNVEKLKVEGLEGYGTNDIYPIDGKVYLYLPNGTHVFTVCGVMYRAVVKDAPTTAVVYTGPTCEGGEIAEGEGGVWVVMPTNGATAVTIAGLPDEATVAVPPSVTKVNGVADTQIKVRAGAYDITGAFTVSGGAIALDPNGSVTIGGETIPVKPTIGDLDDGEPFVIGDTVSVTVKAIPGLRYALKRTDSLQRDASIAPYQTVAVVTATGTRVTLTDGEPSTDKAFYLVEVSVP